MKNLNEFKAFRADKDSNAVLKNCASFVEHLKFIFDKSLEMEEVPNEWREANVTQIFKKGSRMARSNYRPVLVTSSICKFLELIIKDKIMKI